MESNHWTPEIFVVRTSTRGDRTPPDEEVLRSLAFRKDKTPLKEEMLRSLPEKKSDAARRTTTAGARTIENHLCSRKQPLDGEALGLEEVSR